MSQQRTNQINLSGPYSMACVEYLNQNDTNNDDDKFFSYIRLATKSLRFF